MARGSQKLTALKVKSVTSPGLYGDGLGLWLRVRPSGVKSWAFRYMIDGRAREMGLGPTHTITLAKAREKATECRIAILEGRDPIKERRRERVKQRGSLSFRECAEKYIAAHKASWKNDKHKAQWTATLETYAFPAFGDLPVAEVDTADVMRTLEPIWSTKTETASRLRGRIERVLDWAKAREYRHGENPACWRGHLDNLLPARSKVQRVKHHAALPYTEMPGFMTDLRACDGISARALEFAILTGTRSGEVRGAAWDEIEGAVWTIPGERMKAGKSHRVPLSDRAKAILTGMRAHGQSGFIFPSTKRSASLSDMSMTAVLRRMGRNDLTAHGFRSTFRDWAAERTGYPREVCEMALAHSIPDKVEAAYRRGDLFDKRRRLMDEWARYCNQSPDADAEVVPMRRRGS